MNAQSKKASIGAEVMRIAEEREQFIEQAITGRTTFSGEMTHEPHAAKPNDHVLKVLGATVEIETAPRSLVSSPIDDLRGPMGAR